MKTLSLWTGFAVPFMLVSSCGVTPDPMPANQTYTSLSDFHNKHGVATHSFTFNAETGGTFTTPKGTVIEIPANAFYVVGGLATGQVKFEVRDIYKKSDMILSNITTQSDGQPIVSGGEAWFRITQNNQPLYLNTWNPVIVKMPRSPDSQPMQLYRGELDSTTTDVNWIASDTMPPVATQNVFSVFELDNSVYSATLEGSWVNCDHPFGDYTSTVLTINPPEGYGPVSGFLVFNDYNTVVKLYTYYGFYDYEYAPLGYDCTLVALAIKDGKLYTSVQSLTITNNQTVNLNLQQSSPEAFAQQLEALN